MDLWGSEAHVRRRPPPSRGSRSYRKKSHKSLRSSEPSGLITMETESRRASVHAHTCTQTPTRRVRTRVHTHVRTAAQQNHRPSVLLQRGHISEELAEFCFQILRRHRSGLSRTFCLVLQLGASSCSESVASPRRVWKSFLSDELRETEAGGVKPEPPGSDPEL